MTVDEFDTASCTRRSPSNDDQSPRVVAALQAKDFAHRRAHAGIHDLPAHAAALDAWLVDVDDKTLAIVGKERDQLPSWYWADAHHAGPSAHEAAQVAVEDAHRQPVVDGWYLLRCSEAVTEGGGSDG